MLYGTNFNKYLLYNYGEFCFARQLGISINCIVPSQVTNLTVSKAASLGKPALKVNWTTPQSDLAITQYQLEYIKGAIKQNVVIPVSSGSNTSTVLEALDAGTAYLVRIRAVSVIGNGKWSSVESETTYAGELPRKLEVLNVTVHALVFSHPKYSSFATEGYDSVLIDDKT